MNDSDVRKILAIINNHTTAIAANNLTVAAQLAAMKNMHDALIELNGKLSALTYRLSILEGDRNIT